MRKNIVIILAFFHQKEVEVMLKQARITAREANLKIVSEVWVPGSYEVPLALKRELKKNHVDGAVVLGIIERGETKHGLVMGLVVHSAIVQLELETNKPVGKGILGPEIKFEQVTGRLNPYAKQAVLAVKVMLEVKNR